ncbi:MAG: hypothetical protein IT195_13380 [Microthrixaceae bacterium]|nr:hypothetical protein [Microthrixaceae bacterium]
MSAPGGAAAGDGPVTGTVYRDANANGHRDASEPGVGGVSVTATDTAGASIAATSAPDGSYSLNVAGLGAGPFRIEFSGFPTGFTSAPHGAGNPTSVSVAAGGARVDFGVERPDEFCQANPTMAVTCFVAGTGAGNLQTLATFPYSAGTKEVSAHLSGVPGPAGYDQPAETQLASATQTGSVYGEGWHPASQTLYLGAFAKKYVPFGPGGSGAIYLQKGTAAPTLFWSTGSATNRTAPGGNWFLDPWTSEITKAGWGDLDVSGNRLFAVNLEDRKLYAFDVDQTTGALVGSGPAAAVPIPAVGGSAADSRPFALGVRDGVVYVGGVDSRETAGGTPSGWVQTFDPASLTFGTAVLQFPFDYNMGCAYVARSIFGRCTPGTIELGWRRWGAATSDGDVTNFDANLAVTKVSRTQVAPQPILSDIAFADNGDMTIGVRDRWGDQSGRFILAGTIPNPILPALGQVPLELNTYSFGDTLRAERTGPVSWKLENNGTSHGITGTANSGSGPGGGAFYGATMSLYDVEDGGVVTLQGHERVTMGGLHHQPGTNEVATTAYDVFGRWDHLGVRWLTDSGKDAPAGRDSTDLNVRAYSLYEGVPVATPFGKANGLGDLEALCQSAPLEVGNYVWLDENADGVQNPNERPIPGATVTLRNAAGATLATARTDSAGRYWFVSPGAPNLPTSPGPEYGIVAGGIQPATRYNVTFDASTVDTAALGAANLALTKPNVGSDTTDSDALGTVTTGSVDVTTGGPGFNDHSIDAGYTGAVVAGTTTIRGATTTVPIEVERKVQDRPGPTVTLANTGSNPGGLGLVGLAFVLLGLGVLVTSRRGERREDRG